MKIPEKDKALHYVFLLFLFISNIVVILWRWATFKPIFVQNAKQISLKRKKKKEEELICTWSSIQLSSGDYNYKFSKVFQEFTLNMCVWCVFQIVFFFFLQKEQINLRICRLIYRVLNLCIRITLERINLIWEYVCVVCYSNTLFLWEYAD